MEHIKRCTHLICQFCNYSTPSRQNMKQHFRTRKHKENKRNKQVVILTEDEKREIMNKNIERRQCAGCPL
jgi:DNA-directed RNA polymerase subunit M/transcription elongation factor TFIIS